MLKPKEVCQILGVSYRTLMRYVNNGYLHPIVLPSGQLRFDEKEVNSLLATRGRREIILFSGKNVTIFSYDEAIIDPDNNIENLRKLLNKIMSNKVSKVIIIDKPEYEGIIEDVCKYFNCTVELYKI
ncbi:transposase [Betalipothrixvirus uzonense]|uniref:Helix-turn-helix domain-containing protein n=1 Tax=Betalipothrixvirus uzonense TaxID=512792 RepID=B2CRN9_9VIRU|nr:transposase [Acidianus filamentous virus 9]ACB37296.1 hypothetical protein [Acidianus filamentous virus 9]